MGKKAINYSAWVLVLCAMGGSKAALAADTSDWTARAATWEKEYNANNLPGVVALYASDGSRMPPHSKIDQGSDAILAELKAFKDRGVATVKISVTKTETVGRLAYAVGTFEVATADGKQLDHGKWMGVSKKHKGTWKTQYDIWNSDMPMPSEKVR